MRLFTLLILLLVPYLVQSQPTILDERISVEALTSSPENSVRVKYNSIDGNLYLITQQGDLYEINLDNGDKEEVQSNSDHNLGDVQGFDISSDGTFYIVGNSKNNNDFTNTGIIKRGTINDGSWTWETVAETEPYPLSNTFFDHIMNGIVVSSDNQTLYINSGSRTDHGEVHDVDGRFPDLREAPLTAKILRVPANSTNLLLENDYDFLTENGYIFAEGIRNSFSLAFDAEGELFATENAGERDDPGEFNWIQEGNHYGFPWRVGGNNNPMQYAGYVPAEDLLLQPETNAAQMGFFYDDPNYPLPPEGVTFIEPILNYGPDAVMYRDAITDEILNAAEEDTAISSFTAHRSMLGLVFDTENSLAGDFNGDAFSLAFSGGDDNGFFLRWMDDPGKDLLHMELTKTEDTYEMTTTAIARDFLSPVDAEIIGNTIYVLEFKTSWLNNGANTRVWALTFPANGTNTEDPGDFASNFRLNQNYPNPFNPSTRISFELSLPGFVEVEVSDMLGKKISTLVSKRLGAQTHSVSFNASNLSSGIYYYTLKVDGVSIGTKKMALIK